MNSYKVRHKSKQQLASHQQITSALTKIKMQRHSYVALLYKSSLIFFSSWKHVSFKQAKDVGNLHSSASGYKSRAHAFLMYLWGPIVQYAFRNSWNHELLYHSWIAFEGYLQCTRLHLIEVQSMGLQYIWNLAYRPLRISFGVPMSCLWLSTLLSVKPEQLK